VAEHPENLLGVMGEAMRHRGPDASGIHFDEDIALVHRRLSIIDLSSQGNQPMMSSCGRYSIVFNGEIYNFLELRQALEKAGTLFRSKTDTEVLLELFAAEGATCLGKLNGMFAFAIWDALDKKLFLARDRIGKKPLYYYTDGSGRFAFASEIKSILAIPGVPRDIDPTSVCDFIKYHYVPTPKTIFSNIFKLPPGHYLTLTEGQPPKIAEYWDVRFTGSSVASFSDSIETLLDLLRDSTQLRMIADVPLGAFLSGGVDSSAVVALMSAAGQGQVRTCSIGFDDKEHDESLYAREIARLFATEHHEYQVHDNIQNTVQLLPRFFDEPFADSSAVPTFHVSRLARQAVTVALAGDGGDEIFAGYDKYAIELQENLARCFLPKPVLRLINTVCSGRQWPLARKAGSFSGSALLDPARAFYRTNTWTDDTTATNLLADAIKRQVNGYDPAEHTIRHWNTVRGADHVTCMLYTDLKTYLPDDILVKVDRMSMAHGLEVRAPFLDYRIIEFAATLPSHFKIKGNTQKILLKNAFARLLPQHILDRPKHGFTVPLDAWFRTELKSMTEHHLLHSQPLAVFFNVEQIRKLWDEHQAGKNNHGITLWGLLMFALWQREYLPQ
jgi:asparagine synthase (glutamine-hydrolysing)